MEQKVVAGRRELIHLLVFIRDILQAKPKSSSTDNVCWHLHTGHELDVFQQMPVGTSLIHEIHEGLLALFSDLVDIAVFENHPWIVTLDPIT